jgi:hypothetical protein
MSLFTPLGFGKLIIFFWGKMKAGDAACGVPLHPVPVGDAAYGVPLNYLH